MRSALALTSLLLAGCVQTPAFLRRGDTLAPREHYRLGSIYEEQGLWADAATQYRKATERDPSHAEGWLALGNIEFRAGRYPSAETYYRKALKAEALHPAAANNLAMTLLARGGDLDEAEMLAQGALPDAGALRPHVLDTLANIELRRRRYPQAMRFIEEAVAAVPEEERGVREQLLATRDAILARPD